MKNDKIVVGITHGDVNSISYEVIIKALQDPRISELCVPIVYGSAKVAAYHRKSLKIDNFSFNNIRSANEANPKRPNILNCVDENVRVELGKSTQEAGKAACEALEAAMQDLLEKKIDVLVTGPINKHNIQSDRFNYPGHTEFLQAKSGANSSLMLMVNEYFRIGVVTSHVPLADVPQYITKESILDKLALMNQSLQIDFGIRKPKIAVLGLNPHAGDNGVLGNEEQEILTPAIETAREESILAFGPFPADGFFGSGQFTRYDGILAMYHDQGLIPFKAISVDSGVNYTAGLPVIRTSPAHGTAFEIAGKNEASADSFRNAIYLACDIFRTREQYKEISSNPLKTYDIND